MKIGDRVTYRSTYGAPQDAVVTAVRGSGPSNGKVLDLAVGDRTIRDVPHALDDAGAGSWSWPIPAAESAEPSAPPASEPAGAEIVEFPE